jgi:CubicO group peptidase (beta-lactamase class C family)
MAAVLLACACVPDAATSTGDREAPPPSPAAMASPPDHSAFVAAVDALAADAIEHGPIAGLSIAVSDRGTAVLAKGYGLADVESGAPATADTSYPIASVSKNFTAALILRLVEQDRVSLDDPLSRFFPGARAAIGVLTLRHLLDHTSGLTRGGPAPRGAAQSVIRRGGTARSQGETWDYSNYNYSLLGLVIEHVTGRDYASLVRDDLAAPLGLTGTGYCEDGSPVPNRARDYLSGRKRVSPTPYWTKAHFFAGGGLCSTVRDLVRWEEALDSGRVIGPALVQAMRTPTTLPGAVEADYGLGTRMGATAGRRKVGHTGGGQGNKAVLAHYPDAGLTVVVLLNTEREGAAITANGLEERIARLFFASGDTAQAPPAGAPAETPRYAGRYRDGVRLVTITDDAGVLTVRPGFRMKAASRLTREPDAAFASEEDATVALRFHVQDGEARSYARYRNGWFAGVGIRSDEPAPRAAAPGRSARRSKGFVSSSPQP